METIKLQRFMANQTRGELRMKKINRSLLVFLATVCLLLSFGGVAAAETTPTTTDALTNELKNLDNIKTNTNDIDPVYDIMNTWTLRIQVIAIGLCVVFIIIGAIMLGGSLGNSQRRTIGTAAILCAVIAIVAAANASSIAGAALQ